MFIKKSHNNSLNVGNIKSIDLIDTCFPTNLNLKQNYQGLNENIQRARQIVSKKNNSQHTVNQNELRLKTQQSSSTNFTKKINYTNSYSVLNKALKSNKQNKRSSSLSTSFSNILKASSRNKDFNRKPTEKFKTQIQTTNMSNDNLNDSKNSFFNKEDVEEDDQVNQFEQQVNLIPVSPDKKNKINDDLDFFVSKKIIPSSLPPQKIILNEINLESESPSISNITSAPQLYVLQNKNINRVEISLMSSQFRCETVANCEENLQINNQEISRKIINKSLSSVNDSNIYHQIQHQQQYKQNQLQQQQLNQKQSDGQDQNSKIQIQSNWQTLQEEEQQLKKQQMDKLPLNYQVQAYSLNKSKDKQQNKIQDQVQQISKTQATPQKNDIGEIILTEVTSDNRRDSSQYRLRYNCPSKSSLYIFDRDLQNYYDQITYGPVSTKRSSMNSKENIKYGHSKQNSEIIQQNDNFKTPAHNIRANNVLNEINNNILQENCSNMNVNGLQNKIQNPKNSMKKINFKENVYCNATKINICSPKITTDNFQTRRNKTECNQTNSQTKIPLSPNSSTIQNPAVTQINLNKVNTIDQTVIQKVVNILNNNSHINKMKNKCNGIKSNREINSRLNSNRISKNGSKIIESNKQRTISINQNKNILNNNGNLMNNSYQQNYNVSVYNTKNQIQSKNNNANNNIKSNLTNESLQVNDVDQNTVISSSDIYDSIQNTMQNISTLNSIRLCKQNKYDSKNISVNGYSVLPNYGKSRLNLSINSQINSNKSSICFNNKNFNAIIDEQQKNDNNTNKYLMLQKEQSEIIIKKNIQDQNQSINNETIINNTLKIEQKSLIDTIKSNIFNIVLKTFRGGNKRDQCNCDDDLQDLQTCSRARKWLESIYPGENLENLKQLYDQIKESRGIIVEQSVIQQINRDVGRTYPHLKYFSTNDQSQQIKQNNQEQMKSEQGQELHISQGLQSLQNVLYSFAAYEPQIGYVQGINFIAAHFLYHAEEYIAFWLLAITFERFELRDIYLPNLPGLKKHSYILEKILQKLDPCLYKHLDENGIKPEMYITPWLFTQFGMMIPLKYLDMFYENMIQEGWSFFYKFIMSYLIDNRQDILNEDSIGIISVLTMKNNQIANEKYKENKQWSELIQEAKKIPIKKADIENLINSVNFQD